MKTIALIACLMLFYLSASAIPTTITIRVRAKDAKFIGSHVGGAAVQIKNSKTGEILSNGITEGSSGNTDLLLQHPIQRGQLLTDESTAKYVTTLDIREPTLIDIEVLAPRGHPESVIKGSVQMWLIPGKNILGDGIIIELPGLILDVLSPLRGQSIPRGETSNHEGLTFRVSLTMLCGCAIDKGGVWNSDAFEVKAILKKDGENVGEYSLVKLDEINLFEGHANAKLPGNYELLVYAFSAKDGNSGTDSINFVIQ